MSPTAWGQTRSQRNNRRLSTAFCPYLLKLATCLLTLGLLPATAARAATPNSLIMNEANAVSGGDYLGGGRFDPVLGRVQGNGQNWMEFLVTNTDPGKNTLDLRGWKVDWSFNKGDGTASGAGTITFSQDGLWSAVPRGTMLTIGEFQQAWYLTDTPDQSEGNPEGDPVAGGGGMQREGGINGFGNQTGDAYNAANDTLLDFSTDTVWNPAKLGGADWNTRVWAGQKTGGQFQYFSFSGTVTEDGVTSTVGVDTAAGLFVVNNDNWQFTIKDNLNNVIQGPIGEAVPGWTGGGVNSQELVKLEAFQTSQNPTLASYQGVTPALYKDGSSSTYMQPNAWNNYTSVQDLNPLRSWFGTIKAGDANLDGKVTGADYTLWASGFGKNTGSWQAGDFNGDGKVSGADYTLWAANFGSGASAVPTTSVPEPAAWALAALALAGLAIVGRRRR